MCFRSLKTLNTKRAVSERERRVGVKTEEEPKQRRGQNEGGAKTEEGPKQKRGQNRGGAKTEEEPKQRRGQNRGGAKTEERQKQRRSLTPGTDRSPWFRASEGRSKFSNMICISI